MISNPSFTRTESVATPVAIYANFWRRGWATAVDLFLALLLCTGLGSLVSLVQNPFYEAVLSAGMLLGIWLGAAWFESSALQATPGKRLLGLRVSDERGQRISFLRATGRNLLKFIGSSFIYGYLMALASPRCQALHDRFLNTLVTRRPRRS